MAKKPKISKGKRTSIDCLNLASSAMDMFTKEEIKDIVTKVLNRSKEFENLSSSQAIKKALDEVSQEQVTNLIGSAATKARNIAKGNRIIDSIKDGALTLYDWVLRNLKNVDANIENAKLTRRLQLEDEVFKTLSTDEIRQWQDGIISEDEIYAAADGKEVSNPLAKKIGDIIKKYPDEIRNPMMVASDALSLEEMRNDRFLRNIHNPELLLLAGQSKSWNFFKKGPVDTIAPRTKWVSDIKPLLNLDTFADIVGARTEDGSINMAKVDKVLKNIYDNITSAKSDLTTKSTVANYREAIKRLSKQTLIFKDWQSFGKYNKEYGSGTLFSALQADIRGSSNKMGIADIFGDNPLAIFKDAQMAEYEKYEGKRSYIRESKTEMVFNNALGTASGIWSPTIASIGTVGRSFSSVAKLGKLVLMSLPDISNLGSISQRTGFGYWEPFFRGILGQLQLLPTAERELIAKQMHLNLNTQMGYLGAYADVVGATDIASKFSNTFFYYNLMYGWDKSLKISAMTDFARNLGKASNKSWSGLNEQTRFFLEKFNLNEAEWNSLRSKTKNNLFSLDNVNDLTEAEVSKLWEVSDKKYSLSEYRDALVRKVYGTFNMVSDSTVLDPGAFEKTYGTLNMPKGTVKGEIYRSLFQFKAYPIATMRRVWYGGFQDMQGGQAKLLYALNMATGSFALAYLSKILLNFSMGKTTQGFSDFELKDWVDMLAPGLGTYLRVMDPKNQNNKMFVDFFFTPSIRVASDVLVTPIALATGNFKGAKSLMKDFAKQANPIGTLPFAEPIINKIYGKEPYLGKGQRQIYGA